MKYYSEKLDKLFDTEEELNKAESASSSSATDSSLKEELTRTAVKINKLSQAYDALTKEFFDNVSELINDPIIPKFTDQFRKYVEAENVRDDSDLDPEVVDAFMFLFRVMEEFDFDFEDSEEEDDKCCNDCECCDKEEFDDEGNYHAHGETENGTKWSVDIVKDKDVCTDSFKDVLGKFWHSLLS